MFLSIRCQRGDFVRYIGNISSYLLFNEWTAPVLLGIEHSFSSGTAWSFAKESDDDFQKILGQSGLLNTVIPGCVSGSPSLLCTPFLRKGVPCWVSPVLALSAATDINRTPLVTAYRTEQGFFDSSYCLDYDSDTKKEQTGL
jgi:hypothetical protein